MKVLEDKNPYEILFVKLHYERARVQYLKERIMLLKWKIPNNRIDIAYDFLSEAQDQLLITEELASKIKVIEVDIFE